MGVWYCTREDVASAIDVKTTARDNGQVDRGIEAASRGVEAFLHRRFAPTIATRKFDWPDDQMGRSYRLWLNQQELITVTSITTGGHPITNYFLEPVNFGPPYNRVEINLAGGDAFTTGATRQQNIVITGLFGYADEQIPAGVLAGTIDSVVTVIAVYIGAAIGVGTILTAGTERMIVTERAMTGAGFAIGADLASSSAAVTVATGDGTKFGIGETILVDAERMFIIDIIGNNLIVKRAWDGTVLAAHTTGAGINALRRLTVVRGVLGTPAAGHVDTAPLTSWVVPGPVRVLAIAEVLNTFEQEQSAYARTVGAGDSARAASGAGIDDLRDRVYTSHGRKNRMAAI